MKELKTFRTAVNWIYDVLKEIELIQTEGKQPTLSEEEYLKEFEIDILPLDFKKCFKVYKCSFVNLKK